jgi:hypothetical protein
LEVEALPIEFELVRVIGGAVLFPGSGSFVEFDGIFPELVIGGNEGVQLTGCPVGSESSPGVVSGDKADVPTLSI